MTCDMSINGLWHFLYGHAFYCCIVLHYSIFTRRSVVEIFHNIIFQTLKTSDVPLRRRRRSSRRKERRGSMSDVLSNSTILLTRYISPKSIFRNKMLFCRLLLFCLENTQFVCVWRIILLINNYGLKYVSQGKPSHVQNIIFTFRPNPNWHQFVIMNSRQFSPHLPNILPILE